MSASRPSEPVREQVYVENVTIPPNRARSVNREAVARLAESMARIGLQTPISVRVVGDDLLLVAGLHRLEAARSIGWDKIEAAHLPGDDVDARLWEIAENLHRAELSPVERAEHIAEWIKLSARKISRHVDAKLGRPEGGTRAAARELGISEPAAQRAVQIAALPQETRDTAREEGWTQKRLLEATRPCKPVPAIKNAIESEEDWRRQLFTIWNRGAQEWRERALEALDRPVFDRTSAA